MFTYQLAYWAWAKAEADEIRADRDGMLWSPPFAIRYRGWRIASYEGNQLTPCAFSATIAGLEATVNEYQAKTKGAEEKSTAGKSS